MRSEITKEEEDDDGQINTEAQKDKIRRLIKYQKSIYSSSSCSSTFSSAAASCSSFSSSRKSNSLLDLMKDGSTSLRRLFDMEHTSLANHMNDYSGSPITRQIPLWGSDSEDGVYDDPWKSISQVRKNSGFSDYSPSHGLPPESRVFEGEVTFHYNGRLGIGKRKLTRRKSYRRLPRFHLLRWRGFRAWFRLRRVRVMICGRKF